MCWRDACLDPATSGDQTLPGSCVQAGVTALVDAGLLPSKGRSRGPVEDGGKDSGASKGRSNTLLTVGKRIEVFIFLATSLEALGSEQGSCPEEPSSFTPRSR